MVGTDFCLTLILSGVAGGDAWAAIANEDGRDACLRRCCCCCAEAPLSSPPSSLRHPPDPAPMASVPFFQRESSSPSSPGSGSRQPASPYPGPTHGWARAGLSLRAHAPEGSPRASRQITLRCWRPSRPQRTLHCKQIAVQVKHDDYPLLIVINCTCTMCTVKKYYTVEYGNLHHWTFVSDEFKHQNLDGFYYSYKKVLYIFASDVFFHQICWG